MANETCESCQGSGVVDAKAGEMPEPIETAEVFFDSLELLASASGTSPKAKAGNEELRQTMFLDYVRQVRRNALVEAAKICEERAFFPEYTLSMTMALNDAAAVLFQRAARLDARASK